MVSSPEAGILSFAPPRGSTCDVGMALGINGDRPASRYLCRSRVAYWSVLRMRQALARMRPLSPASFV